MPYPVVLFDSTDGTASDSASSGAGPGDGTHPGTKVTGTAAAHTNGSSSTTITLTNAPDLSDVASDGSHCVYLVTSSGRRFSKIVGKDNSAKTLTTQDAFNIGSGSAVNYAIGGKRSQMFSSGASLFLTDKGGAAGDAYAGWTLRCLSGHVETLTATRSIRVSGNETDGLFTVEGIAGAATMPVITTNLNGSNLDGRGSLLKIAGFDFRNTAASKTSAYAVVCGSGGGQYTIVENCRINTSGSAFGIGVYAGNGNGAATQEVRNCDIRYCTVAGVGSLASTGQTHWNVTNCILALNAVGVSLPSNAYLGGTTFWNNLIVGNTSHGVAVNNNRNALDGAMRFLGNTIAGNGGDGIRLDNATSLLTLARMHIVNNILASNGGYGLNFNAAHMTDTAILAYAALIAGNQTYLNTSGAYRSNTGTYAYNACPWATGDTGLDPQFTDYANLDYRIGANYRSKGYPLAGSLGVGDFSSTRYGYSDPGALQRQEFAARAGSHVGL